MCPRNRENTETGGWPDVDRAHKPGTFICKGPTGSGLPVPLGASRKALQGEHSGCRKHERAWTTVGSSRDGGAVNVQEGGSPRCPSAECCCFGTGTGEAVRTQRHKALRRTHGLRNRKGGPPCGEGGSKLRMGPALTEKGRKYEVWKGTQSMKCHKNGQSVEFLQFHLKTHLDV